MKTIVSLLFLCVAGVCLMLQLPGQCEGRNSPILIIPGMMGSRLQVKHKNNFMCSTQDKFVDLWVSLTRMSYFKCAKIELKLDYDANTNSFHDAENVQVKVADFGNTKSVEYLNPGLSVNNKVPYMHELVEYFVDRGYERGKTIRSAPYDWRLAADELQRTGYYDRLKSLIETMYITNGGETKVTLVVHSMGGPVSLHFLTGFRGIDQEWKNKYIKAYVTLSGAWAGGVAALDTVISGTHILPGFLNFEDDRISNTIAPIARTFQSLPWMFPRHSVFGDDVLVTTPQKEYTAADYSKLFSDIGYKGGLRTYQCLQSINPNFPAPNVPTHCYYGIGVNTPARFHYQADIIKIGMKPTITKEPDGDGTVNRKSLNVCHRWWNMPHGSLLKVKSFHGVDHSDIVRNKHVLEAIREIVLHV